MEGKSGLSRWRRRVFQTTWTGTELRDHEKLMWPQPKEGHRKGARIRERLVEARRVQVWKAIERQRAEDQLHARHLS